MKKIITIFILLSGILNSRAQKELVKTNKTPIGIRCGTTFNANKKPLFVIDGILMEEEYLLNNLSPEDIVSIEVLKKPLEIGCYGRAVILITTNTDSKEEFKVAKKYPFTVYNVCNTNWVQTQDIYNSIRTKVPGVQISTTNILQASKITMRGDDNAVVILDGVHYDASILNTINPSDIESIKVSNSIIAQNSLRYQ